jgi:hypothetical protein
MLSAYFSRGNRLWAICHKNISLSFDLSVCLVHAQADRRYDAFSIAVTTPEKIVIEGPRSEEHNKALPNTLRKLIQRSLLRWCRRVTQIRAITVLLSTFIAVQAIGQIGTTTTLRGAQNLYRDLRAC